MPFKDFLEDIHLTAIKLILAQMRCVKNVHIRSYSGPHFPAFFLRSDKDCS